MAATKTKQLDKSRLGRLLVNRGYISEHQLDEALVHQRSTGQKLGEVLVAQGLLSDRDLERTLKHQKRYRYTAAFVAMVVTPLQPAIAFAATTQTSSASTDATAAEQVNTFKSKSGLKSLDDDSLAGVSAQGLTEDIQGLIQMVNDEQKPDSVKVVKNLANVFMPVTNMLAWDSKVEGVEYDSNKPAFEMLAPGKMKLALPTRIEKISLENIKVAGTGVEAPSFGSVYMSDIRFAPDSNVTITVR
ncbi:hypothetical protein [Alkalimarinus sediminis]|uniref:Uncharacterized protein n=1 Tax=Alkalimarinus sediminis TaxID=1632866 RepID=A0A9E8HJQ1_9ALTE|nr:hypothetical protein [Alkalimarinus sediminis]UZW75943.1 hypothetical protein NNL22_05010 [Alkalimarinus sediminis]